MGFLFLTQMNCLHKLDTAAANLRCCSELSEIKFRLYDVERSVDSCGSDIESTWSSEFYCKDVRC